MKQKRQPVRDTPNVELKSRGFIQRTGQLVSLSASSSLMGLQEACKKTQQKRRKSALLWRGYLVLFRVLPPSWECACVCMGVCVCTWVLASSLWSHQKAMKYLGASCA